jgi:hypothetical protein
LRLVTPRAARMGRACRGAADDHLPGVPLRWLEVTARCIPGEAWPSRGCVSTTPGAGCRSRGGERVDSASANEPAGCRPGGTWRLALVAAELLRLAQR